MTQWEYMWEVVTGPTLPEIADANGRAADAWVKRLNELGADGWELVTEEHAHFDHDQDDNNPHDETGYGMYRGTLKRSKPA